MASMPQAPQPADALCDLVTTLWASAQAAGWLTPPREDGWWIRVCNARSRSPAQGWKLHISAGPGSVAAVLRCALPVLLADDANFKVIASIERLRTLNDGAAGLSQVGKCITVYPNDEPQALRLARALDLATRGLAGPAIPSDRPLAAGSLVHYRYGSFAARLVQSPGGAIEWALAQPDGTLVPDVRAVGCYRPAWAVDPFVAAGVADAPVPPEDLIDERYLVIETLAQSARGTVARAIDLRRLRRCVLKRAARHAQLSRSGQDARDRLRHEADVLARLAPDARVPRVFDLIEHAGDLILVLEDLAGEPLSAGVARLARRGCTLPESRVTRLACALAALLQTIHDQGLVYRDLKPANVILGADDQVSLIDFELAHGLDSALPAVGRGTTGYMSPQQADGAPPCTADDVYSLGALLYYAATGAEPGFTPQPDAPLSRSLDLLNPTLSPALSTIIHCCLLPDPSARPSLRALAALLAAARDNPSAAPLAGSSTQSPHATPDAAQFRRLARRLADSLCAAARWLPDGRGPVWECALYNESGIWSRDLYAGSAGTLLVLALLVAELGDAPAAALLRQGIAALLRAPRPAGAPLAGLYFGESGLALVACAAGQALSDADLIAAAGARGHAVAALPCHGPDLMTGAAGRIRLHLLLWEATADPGQFAHAVAMGELLLALAEPIDGGLCWTLPPDYGSLRGKSLLGYAHGAAGIGDALLDLFAATRDARFGVAAQAAARWIMAQATPALNDGSGLIWPKEPGGDPAGGSWCHGAAGIGRFLLHLATRGGVAEAASMAERAAWMVGRGARWSGPTQCHGLTGNIGFLLDMFQTTGAHAYLDAAYAQARLLDGFIVEQDGRLVCQSDLPAVFTPDLMLGYGGVILCLLRLSQPERRFSALKALGL